MNTATWHEIYDSMAERWRPEDVALALSTVVPELAPMLKVAARHGAWGLPRWGQWHKPGFTSHSANFSIVQRYPGIGDSVAAAIATLRGMTHLATDDLRDRLSAKERKAAGITISRRQYMRQCRILVALQRKEAKHGERVLFDRWTRIAKSAWAVDISLSDFFALTLESRAFVAYYVARRQRQSTFSGDGQESAWDKVSEALFAKAIPTASVARVYAAEPVLSAISESDRLTLVAGAYRELVAMARVMDALWRELGANKDTMIVRRGMNSSDWNAVAGAWNAVRGLWLSLVIACGREKDLDGFLPGKAMRLMAADVAYWHRSLGDDEGPDVKIFKAVPLPWDVVLGKAECGRGLIEKVARRAKIEPKGWLAPRRTGKAVETSPTSFLVHGVAVGDDPMLADVLRRAGWFSGGTARPVEEVTVQRDEMGFALKAERDMGDVAQR